MSTLNISLPDQMRSFIEAQVSGGLYSSASDYVRALIREDQQRQEQVRLESQLLAALESGKFEEMTPDFFERLREQARQATARSGQPT